MPPSHSLQRRPRPMVRRRAGGGAGGAGGGSGSSSTGIDGQLAPLDERGITIDNMDWYDQSYMYGYQEKADPYGPTVTTTHLRAIARMFIPAVIIETLLTHLREFGRKQAQKYAIGYQVRLREQKKAPSTAAQKEIDRIADEVGWCGVCRDEEEKNYRTPFSEYLYQVGYDSLVLDRDFTEFIPDRTGKPAYFRALDGATARFAIDQDTGWRYPVQVMVGDSVPRAEWKPYDPDGYRARIGVRRPRPIIQYHGYGTSELEESTQLLYGLHKATETNFAYLDNGLTAAGVMVFQEPMPRKQLLAFQQFMKGMLMGGRNNRRLAIMTNPKDAKSPPQFIPFTQATMKDMEFSAWINFLLKLFCAFYKIDPILIGFQFGNEGQKSTLAQESGKDRLDYGREKGIWPLVRHLLGAIDRYYVQPRYPDFELVAGGLDTETEEQRNKRDTESMKWEATNEIRARRDMKAIDLTQIDNPADVPEPLLPTWVQMQQIKAGKEADAQAAQQQAAGAGGAGDGGGDGGEGIDGEGAGAGAGGTQAGGSGRDDTGDGPRSREARREPPDLFSLLQSGAPRPEDDTMGKSLYHLLHRKIAAGEVAVVDFREAA